jgi:hypothetical protein
MLTQHFPGETEEIYGKCESRQLVFGPTIEPGIYQIRRSANHLTVMSESWFIFMLIYSPNIYKEI